VDATEALLVGTVNPHDREATYKFEYGTTTSYGSTVPEVSEDTVTGDELQDWIDGTEALENWAYRCGLREEIGHGEYGQFRKAWFAFQNQAEFSGTYP
jgi:hypothetical protein